MKEEAKKILLPLLAKHLALSYHLDLPPSEFFSYKIDQLLSLPHSERPKILTTLLAERFLKDNFSNGCYQEKIFHLLLEEFKPLKGYLFYFPEKFLPKEVHFFKYQDFYFLPSFFRGLPEVFINLWKIEKPFTALYVELNSEKDLEKNLMMLLTFSSLGLTRISKKALPLVEGLLEVEKFLSLNSWEEKSSYLVVTQEEMPEDIKGILISTDPLGRKYYLIKEISYHHLQLALETLAGPIGVVPIKLSQENPFNQIPLSLLALASLEHARRAGLKVKQLDGFSLHVLGDLLLELEDIALAKKVYLLAKDYTRQPVELDLSLAKIYYALGDYETAEKLLRRHLCGCAKEDPMIHFNLAQVYLAKEDKNSAEYHLFKAYLLHPENSLYRQRLVEYLYLEDRKEEVLEILLPVKNLELSERLILGKIFFALGNYEESLKHLSLLIDKPERDGEASIYLAFLYLNLKKNPEIAELFLKEAQEKLEPSVYQRLKKELAL